MATGDGASRGSVPSVPPLDAAVVNQITDHAIFLIGTDGRVATWNRGVRAVFGYEEVDWIGQSAALLFLDGDIRDGAPEREMTEAAAHGHVLCDRWLRRSDGTPLFGIGTLYAIRSDAGTLLGFTKVLRDGTRQRQAEDELARMLDVASTARAKADRAAASLDAAIEAIPDGIAISDATGVRRCNLAGLEILGLSSVSALRAGPDLIDKLRVRVTRDGPLLDATRFPFDGQAGTAQWWITRPDGDDVCLAIRLAPIVVGDAVTGTVAVFTDLTRQQEEEHRQRELDRVQTVLRARDQELRALVDGVREYAIFTIDTDGLISSWHEGAELMKGYTAAEAIGMPFANLFTDEEQRIGQPAFEMRMAAEHGAYQGEGLRIRKNREIYEAHVVLTALRAPNGDLLGYLKLTQDITARRRQERDQREALRAAQSARADAERVSRSMGEFLATISHELRTPLSAILGWAAVLSRPNRGAGDLQRGVDAITRNARIQIGLIEDLLDMNRIETGQLRLDMQRVDPATVVAGAIEAVQPAARAKGVRLESRCASAVRAIAGDAARLQQVVWNLLTNAVKFTEEGGTVSVELSEDGDHVRLVVSDTGQGIEHDFLPLLFDRFRQQDATSTRRHGGLGLGLAIVKQLTELHGGTIQAESPGPGRGSTFTVLLPGRAELVPDEHPPSIGLAAVAATDGDAGRRLAGACVLLVDDDDDVREVAALVLRSAGATVELAADATVAFTTFRDKVPDVLISDIGMPGHDGFELLQWVRALGPEEGGSVPALAFTAYAAVDDRRRCLAAGFEEQLVKPVEPDALVSAVHALWQRSMVRR